MGTTDDPVFAGLQALSDAAFPKQCKVCGRRYHSPADFVHQSTAPPGHQSGFRHGHDDDDRPVVELYRNCECGSTLMDLFNDRRDTSEAGQRRRRLFGQMMEMLQHHGLDQKAARAELRKLLRGEPVALLEGLGVRVTEDAYEADRSQE